MTHEEMLEEAARREGTPEAPDANVIITPDLHKDSLDYEDMYYETAHKELLENPRYAVHVHETQINRLIEVLDEVAKRLISLEETVNQMQVEMRFSKPKNDGPPTPPSEGADAWSYE
tara:strand:+ start:636 stop:986 length:351 start_codon:yes stop_codon:yes gene_type:complete